MSKLNETGPRGEGSMTGRGLGNCNQEINNTEENNIPVGRGLGMGMGRDLGRGLQRPAGRCLRGGSGRGRW
ncbi:MAG: DUF5320 family protein [Peptostreptococcaceae bacterium]|nr:DUF5320 family protein [Peptostreptococcaceae bacterium]